MLLATLALGLMTNNFICQEKLVYMEESYQTKQVRHLIVFQDDCLHGTERGGISSGQDKYFPCKHFAQETQQLRQNAYALEYNSSKIQITYL